MKAGPDTDKAYQRKDVVLMESIICRHSSLVSSLVLAEGQQPVRLMTTERTKRSYYLTSARHTVPWGNYGQFVRVCPNVHASLAEPRRQALASQCSIRLLPHASAVT